MTTGSRRGSARRRHREAAEQAIAANPGLWLTSANRAFPAQAVMFLAAESGIRQFLDIGTGLPTASSTHQVAQAAAPSSRIVYVDNDPVVLAHSLALLTSAPGGATAYLDNNLRNVGQILQGAAATLDQSQPVAAMLLIVRHLMPDADDPPGIVARLMDEVAGELPGDLAPRQRHPPRCDGRDDQVGQRPACIGPRHDAGARPRSPASSTA